MIHLLELHELLICPHEEVDDICKSNLKFTANGCDNINFIYAIFIYLCIYQNKQTTFQ